MGVKHKITFRREKRGLGRPESRKLVSAAVGAALNALGVDEPCEISVLLTNGEGIRRINAEFRGVDSETDVLSFPLNELTPEAFDPGFCERDPQTGRLLLGDIVLSIPRCERQALELGHSFNRELSYLTIHSVLHLLGFDHLDEGREKRRMRRLEKHICEEMGLGR